MNSDRGTMADHIEDLQWELSRLRLELRLMTKARDEWRTIAKNLGAEHFNEDFSDEQSK